MLWPTLCVDDFFNNPEEIVNFSKTLKYEKNVEGKWPGERSISLHKINFEFVDFVTKKIISVLFPINYLNMRWEIQQFFQKINGNFYTSNGWVHTDTPKELTAIIYLSNHKKCGTSFFKPKKFYSKLIDPNLIEKKYGENLNENKYLNENNEKFDKILTIDSKFNRLLLFDSNQYHAAEKFKEQDIDEDRLTLITFFTNISGNCNKYPITEMRRI